MKSKLFLLALLAVGALTFICCSVGGTNLLRLSTYDSNGRSQTIKWKESEVKQTMLS
jgi:hypothetical protein